MKANIAILFNRTCINEYILPKFTDIYIIISVKGEGLPGIIINIGFFQRHDWDKKCKFNNKPSFRLKRNSVVLCALHIRRSRIMCT